MTTRAALAAVVMVLTLVVPAFAGPLHELPTGHWAYDVLTDLAASGLIEGYPDGAFRGDRLITRYEAAMLVSRVLARIDAVRIRALPAHLAGVHRLVVELRAELNALGIRAARVEAELARLRVRTADAASFRRPDPRLGANLTLAGAGDSGAEYGLRLQVGTLTGDNHLADPGAYDLRSTAYVLADTAFANGSGAQRRYLSQQALLRAPNDSSMDLIANSAKRAGGALPISSPGMSLSVNAASLVEELPSVWVLASGTVGLTLAQHTEGVWLLGSSRSHEDMISAAAGGPPSDVNAVRRAPDINGQFLDGQRAFADWATWSGIPSLAVAPTAGITAWRMAGSLDLSQWGMSTWNASLDVAHSFYPSGPMGGGSGSVALSATTITGHYQSWTTRGWLARLNLSFTSRTTGSIVYERGHVITTGQPYAEWALRMAHQMAPNATLTLQYHRTRCGSVGSAPCPGFATAGEVDRVYRAELLYSW